MCELCKEVKIETTELGGIPGILGRRTLKLEAVEEAIHSGTEVQHM